MKKRAKVHLLPAYRLKEIETTLHVRGNHDTNYTPHNIYITTDDEIKEGDWYYWPVTKTVQRLKLTEIEKEYGKSLSKDCKKIIATTDPEFNLPQPSKAFIEEYCKAGGIDEVDVEYLRCWDDGVLKPEEAILSLTSNNEIIIHLIDQEKRDCLIAFDDWFNKNWYPEQYSILAIEAYLKTIQ